MYYSLVFPYLVYCIEVCGNASAIHLDALIKVQQNELARYHFLSF